MKRLYNKSIETKQKPFTITVDKWYFLIWREYINQLFEGQSAAKLAVSLEMECMSTINTGRANVSPLTHQPMAF